MLLSVHTVILIIFSNPDRYNIYRGFYAFILIINLMNFESIVHLYVSLIFNDKRVKA